MSMEYETQVLRPGRRESLPPPAVRLGYRLAQLSNGGRTITAQIIITDGAWHLLLPGGHAENLGKNDTTGGSE